MTASPRLCASILRTGRGIAAGAALAAACMPLSHAQQFGYIKTDRPDFVDSSDVVGKGRYQIETSVALERDTTQGNYQRTFTTPTLLRIGVHEALELRLETDGRTVRRTEDNEAGSASTARGYSDLSIGIKWHTQDNEGMKPGIGWLLHADLPTGSSEFRGRGVRPSLRMSAEWELPRNLSLGVMPGLIYDSTDDGRRFLGGIFAISLQRAWTERLSTFAEIAARQIARAEYGGSKVSFDVGAMYLLTASLQLDAALYLGANRNTPERLWMLGLSARF